MVVYLLSHFLSVLHANKYMTIEYFPRLIPGCTGVQSGWSLGLVLI